MSMNHTPAAERLHIGIFGRRNAGKSSIINAVTGQDLAIVSDVKGTTTDPVTKSMELLPLGPVVIIDTPGLDDEGELGQLRKEKACQALRKTDIAVLVVDCSVGMTVEDRQILAQIQTEKMPYILVWNKADLLTGREEDRADSTAANQTRGSLRGDVVAEVPEELQITVSTRTGDNIRELKELIAQQAPRRENPRRVIADLLHPGDFVILVVPIDSSAPKGRLILPQQQTIRDILEARATAIVVRDSELADTLHRLGGQTRLVVTDSQVFRQVAEVVPPEIPLTSFSILFARYKGNLDTVVRGARTLDGLQDGDRILISEGCTHHRQCEDIGTVKLPKMLRSYTGKELQFLFTSGTEFPKELGEYRLIIHCGGCMLNEREMAWRLHSAENSQIPITNYGTAIAHMNGILKRSLEIFGGF